MKKNANIYKIFFISIFILFFNKEIAKAENKNDFRTLKSSKVYVRQGHDFTYPIKFTYKKKYLPVIIIDNWGNFKKIKDYKNNTGWIHISKLSKRKSAINTKDNLIIFKKPTIYSSPLAIMEKGRLVLVRKCKKSWCKIVSSNYTGWVKKQFLWGRI